MPKQGKLKKSPQKLIKLFQLPKSHSNIKFEHVLKHHVSLQIDPIFNTNLDNDQNIYFDIIFGNYINF